MTERYIWSADFSAKVSEEFTNHIRFHSISRPEVAQELALEMGLEVMSSTLGYNEDGVLCRSVIMGKIFDNMEDAALFALSRENGTLRVYNGEFDNQRSAP